MPYNHTDTLVFFLLILFLLLVFLDLLKFQFLINLNNQQSAFDFKTGVDISALTRNAYPYAQTRALSDSIHGY